MGDAVGYGDKLCTVHGDSTSQITQNSKLKNQNLGGHSPKGKPLARGRTIISFYSLYS
jgi:hypothetical protein